MLTTTLFALITSLTATLGATASPYPAILNTTTPSSFEIRVASINTCTKNRNVQLHPSGNLTAPQLASVDPWSPVLLLQLRNGVLYSQNRTAEGISYDLGPVAYLRNVTSKEPSTSLAEFFFANQTADNPATTDFQLVNVSEDAEYNLYHKITQTEVVNGFAACDQGDWYQLFYYTYVGEVPNFGSNCEFVAIQTTVAPSSDA